MSLLDAFDPDKAGLSHEQWRMYRRDTWISVLIILGVGALAAVMLLAHRDTASVVQLSLGLGAILLGIHVLYQLMNRRMLWQLKRVRRVELKQARQSNEQELLAYAQQLQARPNKGVKHDAN